MARRLIVNADDLGQCVGINRGIATAVDQGIVTSSSLMVRWPAAEDAAAWARATPSVSIGLHVDLGEWIPVGHGWEPLYEVVDASDSAAVHDELSRQLGMFLRLIGRPPSHLDVHQHLQRDEPLRSLLRQVGERLGVPVRGVTGSIAYCGSFYGQYGAGHPYPQGITFDSLIGILDGLEEGATELGCHPATADVQDLTSPYRAERAIELAVLTDPRLKAALAARGIQLCSFVALHAPPVERQ